LFSVEQRLDTIAAIELSQSKLNTSLNGQNITFDPDTRNEMRGDNGRELAKIHAQLSAIVKPATPRTILLLATESAKDRLLSFLGPVRLIRGMAAVAIACLIGFIAISLSRDVNTATLAEGIFESSGSELLQNLLFFPDCGWAGGLLCSAFPG
jgi:hypothetical protein